MTHTFPFFSFEFFIWSSCGRLWLSGVRGSSCNPKVVGSIPALPISCKSKCPWARHWTPGRITAAHCSLITKDGLNAENTFCCMCTWNLCNDKRLNPIQLFSTLGSFSKKINSSQESYISVHLIPESVFPSPSLSNKRQKRASSEDDGGSKR